MSIVTIPKEIQLFIFGHLKVADLVSVSETCHRLKDVARDPCLWKKVTLSYQKIKNNNEACRNHVSRCSSLKEIYITGEEKSIRSDKIMAVVMKANKGTLTRIILSPSFAGLSNSSFERIGDMTKLTHLAVGGSKLKEDGIEHLSSLTELKSLKIPGIEGGYTWWENLDVILANLFSKLKKLEEVDIKMENSFPSDGVIESLVNNNPNLHHIDISTSLIRSFFNPHQNSNLTSSSLNLIADKCPKLTYIGIGNLTMFSSNDILRLVAKCPKLKYANFERTQVEDACLAMIPQNCPDLEFIKISGSYRLSADSVVELGQDLPNLKIEDEEEDDSNPELFCSLM